MTLIKCKECEKEISKKAKVCPSCGAPRGSTHYGLWALIFVVFVIWYLGSTVIEIYEDFRSIQKTAWASASTETVIESPQEPAEAVQALSSGIITVGPIHWKPRAEHARSVITYKNDTARSYSTIQIQCVAYDVSDRTVSTFKINYSTMLGDALLKPGTIKIEEAVFRNGSMVDTVECYVDKAKF